jgi:hypothetical protein
MKRRQFLSAVAGLGLGTTYSLVVNAGPVVSIDEAQAADIRERIEALTPPRSLDERIAAEPHMHVTDLTCDFLVAGGGMAGVCAAIAAARHGAKVILVQDRSRLGGNASSEVRMHIVGANHHGSRPGWREGGILEELRLENAVRNPHGHWELWDLLLYDKVVSEPNITLILDASLYAAEVNENTIMRVLVRSDTTEHIYRIRAPFYADCTGDCRLGLEAGARIRTGHEARGEFNESLAPPSAGTGTLGSSILFTSKEHDGPVPFVPPTWARKITKEHLEHRRINSWEYGYWWIEWGGLHDAIHDNERIRFELLSIVMGVWDYIKNSGDHPESANWAMDWIGMIPGKRSSRRLEGHHILTQHDLLSKYGEPADAVAIGGWPFDNHPPAGFDDPEQPPYDSVKIDEVYNIPLRSLISVNVPNLFMAGRNISASHVAFTSTRVMATCAVEGQAIGTAAAICASGGAAPKQLTEETKLLATYREMLLRDDQTIKGAVQQDPADFTRKATASASHHLDEAPPEKVLDGEVRDMPGEWRHRWGAKMSDGEPWLQLDWDAPVTLNHVQITFDSGFQRELTLSESNWVKKRLVGGPQPESVRDYTLLARASADAEFEEIARVEGNYLRLRRHDFDARPVQALRLVIQATNGAEEARVYEVRAYHL